jgi:dTDP-4-dehydrorhamnose reductase
VALKFLVTGVTGQVGGELIKTLAPLGELVAPYRNELDLSNADSVRECIRAVRPQWIVSAGAYTAVDKAESEPDLAYAINAEAPRIIGEEARKVGAKVVHFSTDYVFSGQGTTPYVETDPTGPLGVYGASKLAGEQALLGSGAEAMVFRTSWVYGATGKNFLKTILKLAREREELRIVADQFGAPTWSRDLAQMAAHVLAECEKTGMAGKTGIYHSAGAGETTWAGFAIEAIRQVRELEPETRLARVHGITTAEYSTAAGRPANSRLNCKKVLDRFGWRMPEWRESLEQVIRDRQS